jgi:hypothetical protein
MVLNYLLLARLPITAAVVGHTAFPATPLADWAVAVMAGQTLSGQQERQTRAVAVAVDHQVLTAVPVL